VENDDNKLGAATAITVKRLRAISGKSQDELADSAGLHRTYISQLERGIKSATLKALLKISGALKVGIVEFVAAIEDEREKLQADCKATGEVN
jgi:transcriptional regulator with XRE-family HTH domain